MIQKSGDRWPVEEVLALLKNPDFCADAQRTITEAAATTVQQRSVQERQLRLEELGEQFVNRWGVPPPTSGELLDSDPRRHYSDAIASGQWGLVLVFPSTTNRQIRVVTKQIRSVVRKQHRDALITRYAQLVRWLDVLGFDRPTIGRAVFGRRTGLRRPTKASVIARTPEHRERELYNGYRALGLPEKQIQQRVYRTLRGSEAPASAAVRMSGQRYVQRLKHLNEYLATPRRSEPLSHALTMLFRAADENDATVRQHATAVRAAFERASVPRAATDHRGEAAQERLVETMLCASWGVIPVFPWTTDSDFRASVRMLRVTWKPQPQSKDGQGRASLSRSFESLRTTLVSLFRALSQKDASRLRRHVLEARATFLRAGAP